MSIEHRQECHDGKYDTNCASVYDVIDHAKTEGTYDTDEYVAMIHAAINNESKFPCKPDIFTSTAAGARVHDRDEGEAMSDQITRAAEGHIGWVEFIHPTAVTTHVAYVHEDGSVYLPEGDAVDQEWWTLAKASGRIWPLVRKGDPAHDAAVAAKAWREGFTTGQSRAMRHMSDEPLLPLAAPNPYEVREIP